MLKLGICLSRVFCLVWSQIVTIVPAVWSHSAQGSSTGQLEMAVMHELPCVIFNLKTQMFAGAHVVTWGMEWIGVTCKQQ